MNDNPYSPPTVVAKYRGLGPHPFLRFLRLFGGLLSVGFFGYIIFEIASIGGLACYALTVLGLVVYYRALLLGKPYSVPVLVGALLILSVGIVSGVQLNVITVCLFILVVFPLMATFSPPPELSNRQGLYYFHKGSYERAVDHLNKAIRRRPAFALALMNRGAAYLNLGRLDQAMADLNEGLRLDGDRWEAYFWRGLTHAHRGAWDEAIADLSQAIRMDDSNAVPFVERGMSYLAEGEPQRALADMNTAVAIDPGYFKARYGQSCAHTELGQFAAAIESCQRAVERNAAFAEAHSHAAILWATSPDDHLRDGQKAVGAATKSCELTDWNDWKMLSALAAAWAEVGQFDQAVHWAEEALRLAPPEEETERKQRIELYRSGQPYRWQRPPTRQH